MHLPKTQYIDFQYTKIELSLQNFPIKDKKSQIGKPQQALSLWEVKLRKEPGLNKSFDPKNLPLELLVF